MKLNMKTLLFAALAATAVGFTSCSDDDFTDTIFNTDPTQDYLDRTLYSFPLDTFVKAEFLEPYNVKFTYKFEDKASDMNKNLTPARYDKSVDLAVLTKYLWYDVYKDLAGVDFLKVNSPRIINVTGSKNRNVSSGTETLGDASSGVKINLYNVNNLNVEDIDNMNTYFFKTMHHEFAHILDQTYVHPTAFNVLSNGLYDASGWSDAADSLKAGSGFISPYASSAYSEDWAESFAMYVTSDSISYATILGSAEFEWEEIECSSSSEYEKRLSPGCNLDTIGYFKQAASSINNKIYRRRCLRDANDNVVLGADGKPQWLHTSGVNGKEVILQKIDMVRSYLKTYYSIDLDQLRKTVQERAYVTNADGTFQLDRYGKLVNKFTSTQESGKTLIDELRQQVYKFEELMK